MWPVKKTPAFRVVAWALGLLLLGGAVAFALGRTDFAQLRHVHPLDLGVIALAVACNLLLAAALFWVVTLSFDATPPVRYPRMLALISASALLNYLPFQAGSIGRAAYLKMRNNLPLRQSVVIQLIVSALTVIVPVICFCVLLAMPAVSWRWGVMVALVLLGGACTKPIARALLRRPAVHAWAWLPLRAADLFFTSWRIWSAFSAVGHTILYPQALALAAGVVVVNLVSFTPNGLGLREWAVAAMAGFLATPGLGPVGVLATLVDRGVEAAVLVVAGLVGSARLKHAELPQENAQGS